MHELKIPRRAWLQLGGVAAIASLVPEQVFSAENRGCSPPIPKSGPANGGPCPSPIPWLDKNGNHNQLSAPDVELNHIFHFKGKLGRCAGFTGMGTDNKGNRLPWGAMTTDYSYLAGEYWAARKAQQGAFTHI